MTRSFPQLARGSTKTVPTLMALCRPSSDGARAVAASRDCDPLAVIARNARLADTRSFRHPPALESGDHLSAEGG